ncbi:isoprenoid synthase domain-containing protein [Trametes punicea]|nr:isoprenoid synthase domain-containing protein [Trametes punicea]
MRATELQKLPTHLCLQNLTSITALVFEFKLNRHLRKLHKQPIHGLMGHSRMNVYNASRKAKFLSHPFDSYAEMGFPDADTAHLETCIAFFFFQDAVRNGVNISMEVFKNPDAVVPKFPYAAMLHVLVNVLFGDDLEAPPVQAPARCYSLYLQSPEYVWERPILQELSKAAIDIVTWPNDLCSFNKEQADRDFPNLVFCIMTERDTDLQGAVDILTDMLAQRVADYARYKSQLPSFGTEVDAELARYIKAMEKYTQGTTVWYHKSPRKSFSAVLHTRGTSEVRTFSINRRASRLSTNLAPQQLASLNRLCESSSN